VKDLFTGVFCPRDCDRPSLRKVRVNGQSDYEVLLSKMRDSSHLRLFHGKGEEVSYVGMRHSGSLCFTGNSKGFATDIVRELDWYAKVNTDGSVVVIKNRFGGCIVEELPGDQ